MGDDDVICLSSDDEQTSAKLPVKKPKLVEQLIKVETKLLCSQSNKSLKRKALPQSWNRSSLVEAKKQKIVPNIVTDEVIIVSPQKSSNGESRTKSPESRRIQKKAALPQRDEKSNAIEAKKTSCISESKNQGKSGISQSHSNLGQFARHTSVQPPCDYASVTNGTDQTITGSKSKEEYIPMQVKNFFAKPNSSHLNSQTVRMSRVRTSKSANSSASKTLDETSQQKMKNICVKQDRQPVSSRSPSAIICPKSGEPGTSGTKNLCEKTSRSVEKNSSSCIDIKTGSRLSQLPNVQIVPKVSDIRNFVSGGKTTREKSTTNLLQNNTDSQPNRVVSTVSKNSQNVEKSKSHHTRTTTSSSSPSRHEISRSKDITSSKESPKISQVEIVNTAKTPKAESTKNITDDKTKESGKNHCKTTNNQSIRGSSKSPTAQISPRIDTPKSSRRGSITDKRGIDDSTKSENFQKSMESSSSERTKVVKTIRTTDPELRKSSGQKSLSSIEKTPTKCIDVTAMSDSSSSPEVLIVNTIETPKSSRNTSNDKASNNLGKDVSKFSDVQSPRKSSNKTRINVSKTTDTQDSGPPTIKAVNTPTIKKSDNMESAKVNSPKNKENHDKEISRSKPTPRVVKITELKKMNTVIRKITPRKIVSLTKPDEPKSDDSQTPIPEGKNVSPKSSSSNVIYKPPEPTPGCSKTPDNIFSTTPENDENTSLSSSNLSPPKMIDPKDSYMTAVWKNNELQTEHSQLSNKFEPAEKPHLIVRTKKPADPVEQDTFAMFLSLCLQTERSAAMEKIIAKLKRSYECLDPRYSSSRQFHDLIDVTRDKIMLKGRVYYYIGQVAEEMKIRKKRVISLKVNGDKKTMDVVNGENDGNAVWESNDGIVMSEDPEESRRLRRKIKTIEKTMEKCRKRIRELEVAEVDFDDEQNSHFMKLDRYKEKMVELYTKMCEYTKEQADAGRAYLRPKHLRLTQIPSIDQAISSFINSKLLKNRKKPIKPKSFGTILVFPDYIDILECVSKVNNEQKLGMDKRKQQQVAEDAFTQLGRHLQDARQKDYWDTFSLDLETDEDPAALDPVLSAQLVQNQELAEKRMKEIFEEYVRKQEERNTGNHETSSSETEDDEDEDDEVYDDKKSNRDVASEDEHSDDEDNERRSEKNDVTDVPTVSDAIQEQPIQNGNENGLGEKIRIEDKTSENNNVLETSETKIDNLHNSSDRTKEISIEDEIMENEVNHGEGDTEDVSEPVIEQPRPLRIRSFAKTPSTWTSSQEIVATTEDKGPDPKTGNLTETIDVLDEEPNVTTLTDTTSRNVSNVIDSHNVIASNIERIPAKITLITKKPLNNSVNCSSNKSSNLVKSVPNQTSSALSVQVSKELTILPVINLHSNDQNPSRQSNPSGSMIPGVQRNHNVSQNISQISAQTQNPLNVVVQSLDSPQHVEIRVAKNFRQIAPSQVQIVRLDNRNCLPAKVTKLTTQLQPISSNASNQIRFRLPAPQTIQQRQIQTHSLNNTQQVRIQSVVNSQIGQPSQGQILRFSNGQYIRAKTATIVPFDASQSSQRLSNSVQNSASTSTKNFLTPQGITLNNPRFIRIAAAAAVAAVRSTNNAQLRVERIENPPQRSPRLSNSDDCDATTRPELSQIEQQRTIPILKVRTSNNTVTTADEERIHKRQGQKNWWIPPDEEPPCKK